MKSKILRVDNDFGLTVVTVLGKPLNTKIGRVITDDTGNRYRIDSVTMPHYAPNFPVPDETTIVLSSMDRPPQVGGSLMID